jgi:Arylsulfotransferase (ASST)
MRTGISKYGWIVAIVSAIILFGCASDEDAPVTFYDGAQDDDGEPESNDDDDDNDDDAVEPAEDCNILDVQIEDSSDDNPLARVVVVQTDDTCSLSGMVTSDAIAGIGHSSPSETAPALEHQLVFYGLAEETDFHFTIHIAGSPKAVRTEGNFSVGALPVSMYRPSVENTGGSAEDTWVAFVAPWGTNSDGMTTAVIQVLDRQGRVRYFHQATGGINGGNINSLQVLPDGSYVFGMGRDDIVRAHLDGTEELVFKPQYNGPVFLPFHHRFDMREDLRGGLILFNLYGAGFDCDGITASDSVVGDGVAMVDENGNEQWRWTVFDKEESIPANAGDPDECEFHRGFFGPGTIDWTHGNSVERVSGEKAFLLSLRNLHRILKINEDTGQVMWQVGKGLDFDWIGGESTESRWFGIQHHAQILSNGNLLLFDNHFPSMSGGPWSRGLELEMDEVNMTVEMVWEFRVPYTMANGSIERLANGNSLISSGNAKSLFEADANGNQVWSADFDQYPQLVAVTTAAAVPAYWTTD